MNVFQERLEASIRELGMNTSKFAEYAEIRQQTLYHYLKGERSPTGEMIFQLAKKLKKSADWLLGLTDDPSGGPPPNHLNLVNESPAEYHTKKQDLPAITHEDLASLIEENKELSHAASAMGDAHKDIAATNAILTAKLVEFCDRAINAPTPVNHAKAGGRRATKHVATGG